MDNNTKVSEGHLTAMASSNSVLLGFSLYFFKVLNEDPDPWVWWEMILLTLCMGGFAFAILVSLYPKELKLKRMKFAWWSTLIGFIGFAIIAIMYALPDKSAVL